MIIFIEVFVGAVALISGYAFKHTYYVSSVFILFCFVFLFFHTAICGVHRRGHVFCFHWPSSLLGECPRLEVITIQ